ncbi:hypothetical protein [Agarivorans sp. DSG3-1]|uniref:hypothetical protein n=1 Tax=Agarivorans sp. DSG3-1 TaxID=3342249 RepID=UPI00398F3671
MSVMQEKWTKPICIEKAKLFSTRQEWNRGHNPTYSKARRKGWLDELCGHMVRYEVKPNKHTYCRCKIAASKFRTRQAWNKGDNATYQAAYKKGWLDEMCEHMEPSKTALKWTLKSLLKDAEPYLVRYHWKLANPAGYLTARKKGWLNQCCAHMKEPHGPLWTLEMCIEDAKLYQYKGQWQRNSSAYKAALRNNWLEKCCKHMTPAPPTIKYSKGYLKKTALKYKRIVDWQRNDNNTYAAALRRGFKSECTKHMEPAFKWTKELCLQDALLYEYRTEWKNAPGNAYGVAYKNGWQDDCVKHMKSGQGTDNDSLYIWQALGFYDEYELPVYKIGVTSHRLGVTRISSVADRNGLEYEIVRFLKVKKGVRASVIEVDLLKFGQQFNIGDFNGSQEFRSLSEYELESVLTIMDGHASA